MTGLERARTIHEMAVELPRCAACRVGIRVGQNVVFRPDGRVHHAACPPIVCPICTRPVQPDDPIRRDGDTLVHGNCWARYSAGAAVVVNGPRRDVDGHRRDVAALIRDKVASGTLPRPGPDGKVWAGSGSGRACDGCEEAIPALSVECEVEVAGRTLRFHRACLEMWHASREISGGCTASPWTLIFHEALAQRAAGDPLAFEELMRVSAETRHQCSSIRALSLAVRTVSSTLRGGRPLRAPGVRNLNSELARCS